jgi:hypothetical protein
MNPILGIFRTNHLRKRPLPGIIGNDLVLLTRIALIGDIKHTHETSISRREFRIEDEYTTKLKRYKSTDCELATSKFSKFFPFLVLPIEIMKVIFTSDITFGEKFALGINAPFSFIAKYISGRFYMRTF